MRSGRLRHRIVIQDYTETVGETGQSGRAYSTFAERWADIAQEFGTEGEDGGQIRADNLFKVRIRHTDGLTQDMRILWTPAEGQRILSIRSIMRDRTNNRFVIVQAEEQAETV